MNRIRAFVALTLPVAVIQQVAELQAKLRLAAKKAQVKVGWVPPPNMHLTLKFLAYIPEESVYAIRDLFAARLGAHSPFSVTVRGTGAFPSPRRPRVLWAGIHCATDALERLAGEVDEWLSEIGFEKESRPFHPHLTLGRVKEGDASELLQGLEEVELGEATVHEVVLYRSVLQREGAEYTALFRTPLAATRREGEDNHGR